MYSMKYKIVIFVCILCRFLFMEAALYASEPVSNPTNLIFANVKSYRLTIAFAAPNPLPDGGYLVIRKTGLAINDVPTDGKMYTIGDSVGICKVVYSGFATSAAINNIIASTRYYFAIFSYNGAGQLTDYKQLNPLKGNIISSASMQGANEYNGVSAVNASFVQDVHNKINPHISIPYNSYDETNIALFSSRDTTAGQKVITCAYSGEQFVYTAPFQWGTYSREHTYCHSWMPTNPANNPELSEYNDQYHLFTTNQIKANQPRSNFPLGIVVNPSYTYLGCKFGTDALGNLVFEPRNQQKGDAARALFYMAVCYNGIAGNNWSFPIVQDQEVLKQWHWQDPPDGWEIARNDFLDSLQGNRNPFVDSVNWVCYIDFSTMTKVNNPQPCFDYVSIKDEKQSYPETTVYPNPTNGSFKLNVFSSYAQQCHIEVMDVCGKKIIDKQFILNYGSNVIEVNIAVSKGIYLLKIIKEEQLEIKKISVK